MLILNLSIGTSPRSTKALPPLLRGGTLALALLAVLLFPASPAFPSVSENDAKAASHPAPAAEADLAGLDLRLDDAAAGETERFRGEFKAEYPQGAWDGVGDGAPSFLLQRGEYGVGRVGLFAEMGDISIRQTSNTVAEAKGRGGRFGFLTGSFGNSARFETFAAAGAHGNRHDDMLVGATGEISLLRDSARVKTIYLSGRHSLDKEGRWPDAGAKKGDVLGVVAVLDPFEGRLAAEAELDYSVYDGNTADETAAVRDSACRLKVGGGWGNSRYTALYERTGPQYRLVSNRGPARDSEGVSLGMGTSFELHAIDLKLSRYNDNTDKNVLLPRLYRYEGVVDYRFRGFKAVPVSLQYRKTHIDSANEPLGYLPKDLEEDAVSGRMNYLSGRWDLGLRGTLMQRTDKLSGQRQAATQTLGFLPKYVAGAFTVAPDFSLKQVNDYSAKLRTDHYIFNLGLSGNALKKRLDYEINGGIRKEITDGGGAGKDVVGAKVKAAYPLARFFNWTSAPSLAIKGEYKGMVNRGIDRREDDFSVLFSLDGVRFL